MISRDTNPNQLLAILVFFLLPFQAWNNNTAESKCDNLCAAEAAMAPFITTWKTDNPGSSNNTSIIIGTIGFNYNYDVDWDNDGIFDEFGLTGNVTHDYGVAGTYTIRIQGDFPWLYMPGSGDAEKLLSIDQWGDIVWQSMVNAFAGASNLTYNATDIPNLSNVTSMFFMFKSCSSFNGDIGNWDVSNVTNMNAMFDRATSFNQDLNNWDVSNVTNMGGMFFLASAFNGDISNWDVSNVTAAFKMFTLASTFNSDISNWDVSNLLYADEMFFAASAFNADIGNWDVSNVKSMRAMFFGTTAFNADISNWDVSNVTMMESMFSGASIFNADISNWNVGNVTNMNYMFSRAAAFNADISNWDVGNVTTMGSMFSGASIFNADIGNWDVSNVTNMSTMFSETNTFNGDISNWDVSNVTNMSRMFDRALAFNQNLGSWDVSNVTNMSRLFDRALAFNQNLGNWDITGVTNMFSMLFRTGLDVSNYDQTLMGWAAQSVHSNQSPQPVLLKYCQGVDARNILINTYGWTFLADQLDCSGLNSPPMAICKNLMLDANANCQAVALATAFDNGSSDPDMDILTFAISPQDPFLIGATNVTLTVSDPSGETSQCTASITVVDNTTPSINCVSDYSVNTDPMTCSASVTLALPAISDNCGVTVLRYRHRPVDAMGDDIPGMDWSSWSPSSSPTVILLLGYSKIQWQAKDAANLQDKCAFILEVKDMEAPTPVCLDPIIDFNGETSISLVESDVWDPLASMDNCGSVSFVSLSPNQVTCDQIGSIIPITVIVEDGNGNSAPCTANVMVGGLPCGWSGSSDGINCADGSQPGYDPSTDTYSITSEGCYDPNFYSSSDVHGFIGIELCGDGEIIAQITQVSGNGFAGISMRENLTPTSKMLQLSLDGYLLTKREARISTGSPAFNHLFQTQGKDWLRLTRSGNTFSAMHSLNGTGWAPVFVSNIMMPGCIEVGFYTENAAPTGALIATFENVVIKSGGSPLSTPEVLHDIAHVELTPTLSIYPNPAQDEALIDLSAFMDQQVTVRVLNKNGQVLTSLPINRVQASYHQLDLKDYPSGLYFVQLITDGRSLMTKKLSIIDQ